MLKLGIAVANEGLASWITKRLTKDKVLDTKDCSSADLNTIEYISKHCDLMLIDKNMIENPRGFCPLKKPSDIIDFRSQLYQLGFSHSQGTDLLAEVIYDCYKNRSKKFVLKKSYEKLAIKYSTQPESIKWSVMSSYRYVQSTSDVLDKFTGLKEFVWWMVSSSSY